MDGLRLFRVVARGGELAHLLCSAIIGVSGVSVLECLVNETGEKRVAPSEATRTFAYQVVIACHFLQLDLLCY